MAFKFSKLAKSLGLGVSKQRKGLAAHRTAYVLRNLQGNRHLSKKKKNWKKKKINKRFVISHYFNVANYI